MAITHVFMLVRTESKHITMPPIQTAYRAMRDDTDVLDPRYQWASAPDSNDIANILAAGVPQDSGASVQVLAHNIALAPVKQALVEHVKEEAGQAIERTIGMVEVDWAQGNSKDDKSALLTVTTGHPSKHIRFEIVSVRVDRGAAG